MQLNNRYRYCAILLAGVLLCSACSDESEKLVQSVTTGSDESASEIIAYSKIPSCDEYFNLMQACANAKLSSEERQNLKQALSTLGENMVAYDDQVIFELQCKKALENIDLHKKEIGCET